MELKNIFRASAIAAALVLAGCGGDININEGDVDNSITNPPPPPVTPPPPPTTDVYLPSVQSAVEAGYAVDASSDFPSITDKPIYRLSSITSEVKITNDAHWVLNGRVAVGNDNADSAILHVQAGTTIFGETGDDYLVVRRGSQIDAKGTAAQPITMTSQQDLEGAETTIGQWGGLVLLGNAPTNLCNTGDDTETSADELASCGVPAEGDAGQYGGNDPEDNSGTLQYIVVKHAGKALASGDELNGISFAGIGSGTVVDHIQVHQNLDDGIEFFGGTVSVSHIVLTDIGDDSLDWSFGWTGSATKIYIQQSAAGGDNAIEADNNEDNPDWSPLTKPTVSNVTIVGADGTNGVRLRNGTAGVLSNILVTGPATYENCLRVNGAEAIANAVSGELTLTNSVVACTSPANNFGSDTIGDGDTQAWFEGQTGNQTLTTGELLLEANGYFPTASSPLVMGDEVVGAFDPTEANWLDGWTVAINGGFPTDIQNAFEQGLATDVSTSYPELDDKPVYKLADGQTFVSDVTLTNNAHWIIKGRTAVGNDNAANATLYIEQGTTIIGEDGNDFLVVRRGSKIEAVGTASAPITMTSIQDVLGQETSIGQWGGVVMLGNAPTNLCNTGDDTATSDAELASCGVPAEGDAGQYGGNNPEDNSGTLKYLVVKHAGKALAAGDELNGISFAGIGSGTKVEFIQVHQNLDDGIEFFGGTVSVRNVVLTDIGDDSLDWSFGWTGNAQNVYIQQSAAGGDNAIEADNNEDNPDWTPLTKPTVANVTIVGADGTNGVRLRNGTAGVIRNLVVTGPDSYKNCVRVNGAEAIANAVSGELSVQNSVVACSETGDFGSDTIGAGDTQAWFEGQTGNSVVASSALLLSTDGFTPKSSSPLLGSGVDLSGDNPFFVKTDYIGAFDGENNWMEGWTVAVNEEFPANVQNAFEQSLATDVSASFPEITDKPVYQLATNTTFTADVTLTNDAHWLIKGRTAVGEDNANSATLYVQRGTTIFGEDGNDFLVVRRGSKIEAAGTATLPITMTSVQDLSGQETSIGQWGGLVVLGNAPTNLCNTGDDTQTSETELTNCGVPAEGDAGQYGGNNPEDNSGTLKYVVVKHAGKALAAGDELNGISLAGVGSGTDVDYIHVHENLDDGVEFFGGTVNVSHLVLTSIGDDSMDWSFGWTGKAQYVLVKQDVAGGDNAIEADNNEDNPDWIILTKPTVSNVTIIGAAGTNGVRLRNGTAGVIKNLLVYSTSSDYSNCLRVNGAEAIANAVAGELSITHSTVACDATQNFGSDTIGDGDTNAWFNGQTGNTVSTADMLGLDANGFTPAAGSGLLGNGFDSSSLDNFFDSTDYIGAFDGQVDWTLGWVTVGLED
ncbi:hypothetical protein [Aliiglaciecola sp. LCG003]|uniref:hypothetical protein n=1 Tax=Aliiglaciecola sp. LCG003 TaxID=3053655 RepID=UPI0025736D58|nr:hypothetical protein [Aliiglaciecola sp. LCG003]WJG08767.1 hypothetical protein QR722_15695 [Aliiglaciecola sp. LCG003]